MNIKAISIKLACAAILVGATAATGCDKGGDDEGYKFVSARATLTLSTYFDGTRTAVSPVWASDVDATLAVGGAGESKVATAKALSAGSQKGEFLFNVDAPATAVPIASWYPATANVKCADGKFITTLPANQNGEVTPLLVGHTVSTVSKFSLTLTQLWCTMYIRINQGSYSIVKAEVKGNNNENIAGDIAVDMENWTVTATAPAVTVTPEAPLDCNNSEHLLAVMLAPVTLSDGYTVTLTTTSGETFTVETDSTVELRSGGTVDTSDASSTFTTKLLFCGDNNAIIINAAEALATGNYKDAIEWSWDSSSASKTIGLAADKCRVGEGKIVDNGSKILFMGSTGWCVLLEKSSKNILWHTTNCPNVHSGDLLPNGYVVLACSTGSVTLSNKVVLYDSKGTVKGSYDLQSAHGIVWNSTTERLYAIGGKNLQIYKFVNGDTDNASLELERTVTTPQNAMHDLMLVTPNILSCAGKSAWLYDIAGNTFTEMTHFSQYEKLKSVNYNIGTGEAWYTDSTNPESHNGYDWSTWTLRYTDNVNSTAAPRTIRVEDIDIYKCRVYSW